MKKYIAVFEVPDNYEPADQYTSRFYATGNCLGYFCGDAELHEIKAALVEVD